MSVIFSFTIVIIFIALTYLIRFSIKNMGGFNHEKLRWILIGYVVILLLAVGLYYMLPTDSFLEQKTLTPAEIEESYRQTDNFYEAAQKGQLDQTDGIFEKGNWSFAFTEDTLGIKDEFGQRVNGWVIVEKDAELNNEIRIHSYVSSIVMNGIDLTNELKAPSVYLQNGTLIVTEPERYEITFANFNKEYVIGQFLETKNNIHTGFVGGGGYRVLYVKIPENVEISNKEDGIQMMDDLIDRQ